MSDLELGSTKTALALMGMALSLLERAGCTLAAARLQHAIDTLEDDRNKAVMPSHPASPNDAEPGRHDDLHGAAEGEGTSL
jgi:hypothetical protein